MAITQQEAITAAKESEGNITTIARKLGCDRAYVYRLQDKWPKLAQVIRDERESFKDFTESQLGKQIKEGNITAIIFFLKTQGKDRGYTERTEITGADGDGLRVVIDI